MYELTNVQRKCFGLVPVDNKWEKFEAKPSPYNSFKTLLYLEHNRIVKCIHLSKDRYCEYELCEEISADRKYLLPKTSKGKPVLLSASTVQKCKGTGMMLSYYKNSLSLYNECTNQTYYSNYYLKEDFCDTESFQTWVEKWCEETTPDDIEDISRFSQQKPKRVRFSEGDIFRFKIGRRLYGYGHVLLNYDQMRKRKEPFWDCLMCKPVVCSVYHLITERTDVSVEELKGCLSLPSTIIADNYLFYGDYEIIGNIPISENEDYPIMYGRSISALETDICYQQGKVFRKSDKIPLLYQGFTNNGVGFFLNVDYEVLMQCIKEKSNEPYWRMFSEYTTNSDLRNPKFKKQLAEIRKQFGLQE